jgi:hypothetical protein
MDAAKNVTGNEGVYEWARATRSFTRSQVRALQVCNVLLLACSESELVAAQSVHAVKVERTHSVWRNHETL